MESQRNIVILKPITMVKFVPLILTLFLLAISPSSLANNDNKPPSQVQNVALDQAASGVSSTPSPAPDVVPNIFTPPSNEDESNGDDGAQLKKDIEQLNKSSEVSKPQHQDNHQFYKPEYIKDPERAMSYWVDFSKIVTTQSTSTKHEMLSKSYRRAAPLKLNFDFPFYGQPLRNIIVATGGFLYLGEHIHHWLAATQNISPLMANFDLSTSNTSDIYHYDNGSALVVQWQDVQMRDNKPPGNFSFQVTLHKNGDIVFVYKSLPVTINEIPESEHPVKVGISDAFLIDKVAFFIRRKTIFDYHRLNLKDVPEIRNQSAIYLKALPTCNQFDSCETCSKAVPTLDCIWCPSVKRCSNGFDRKRQEWLSNSCDKIQKSDCTARGTNAAGSASSLSPSASSGDQASGSQPVPTNANQPMTFSNDGPTAAGRHMMLPDPLSPSANQRGGGGSTESSGGTAFVTFLMFMGLVSSMALWAFYAYRNPHTPSGQMLIKYRPSNWRWQDADARYTAASIHM